MIWEFFFDQNTQCLLLGVQCTVKPNYLRIPISITFGQMTFWKRSCTGKAAVTFRPNYAVIFTDLPVAKFKQKLCDLKASVEKPQFWTCDVFVSEIFLRLKLYNPKKYYHVWPALIPSN